MLPLTRSRGRQRFFGGGWNPFSQLGPTLDLSFAGVVTDLIDPNGYTLNTNFIAPQYQIAAQYVVWETNVGLVDKTFSQIITFTRASTGTFFNSAGTLTSAAIDAPRFDYDPATLAARGFLIEEQRTNLVLQSEDFANSAGPVLWIWPAGVVTGNTEVAPDGTTTADTVTSSGGAQSIYQSVTVTASTSYTFSVFVKLGTMSAANYKIAFYDNIAATFIASDIVPTQVPNTSSWTRINYTFTTPVGCTSVRVYPFRNSATIPSSTVFIWGAQVEAGAFPTSYIPTTTTALTRSADVASVNTLSPWFNASASTLYAEILGFAEPVSGVGRRAANFSDGTTSNRVGIGYGLLTNQNFIFATTGGVQQASVSVTGTNSAKIAAAWATNDAVISANGGSVGSDTPPFVIPTVTQLDIGSGAGSSSSGTATQWANGWIRRITYYPRRLSNAELVSITT